MNQYDFDTPYDHGFHDGHNGIYANPHAKDTINYEDDMRMWCEYERGYGYGVAEKKRAGNDKEA